MENSLFLRLLREKAQDQHGDDKGEGEEYECVADGCRRRADTACVVETMHAGEQIFKIMDEIVAV